jgi:hypothetical protein
LPRIPASTMSSSGFSSSLVIDRPGCRRTQGLILCSMLLALAALGYGGLPAALQAVAMAFVAAGGAFELRRVSPHAPRCVTRIVVTTDGHFLLGLAGDPATLVPAAVENCWALRGIAVGLAFSCGGAGRVDALLFRDRVSPDAWRRLAVRLRHAVGPVT